MKFLKLLIAVFILPAIVLAQDDIDVGHIVGGGKKLGARTSDNQTIVGVIGINSNSDTLLGVLPGKEVQITNSSGTPVAKLGINGVASAIAAPVITPMTAITPVAGAVLSERVSIMATAAPTFAIVMLPAATSNANKSFGLYNKNASPTLIHLNQVASTDSINALGAGTPYSCATTKFCDCRVIGAGTYMCVSQ